MPKKDIVQLTAKERQTWEDTVRKLGGISVGIQIVSCDLANIAPETERVRFSRTFAGEPGSTASL